MERQRLANLIEAVPESIVLSQISAGAAVQATARIFTFGKDPPEISKLSTTDPQTSQFFSLSSAPLAAQEIAAETGATGGFLLSVDVKPEGA